MHILGECEQLIFAEKTFKTFVIITPEFCNIPWVSYTCKRQITFFINLPTMKAENREVLRLVVLVGLFSTAGAYHEGTKPYRRYRGEGGMSMRSCAAVTLVLMLFAVWHPMAGGGSGGGTGPTGAARR